MRKINLSITIICLITIVVGATIILSSCTKERDIITVEYIDKIKLGKLIFNDKNLSSPMGLSCSSCHSPSTGFSDPNHSIVSESAVNGLFGNRNAPNIAYSMFSPSLYFDNEDSTFVGGFFLDGRANSLKEQAHEPFLDPLEMNIPNVQTLINKIKAANYYPLYRHIWRSCRQ